MFIRVVRPLLNQDFIAPSMLPRPEGFVALHAYGDD